MIYPVPRDIPLPLPASPFFLEPLLITAFIAHIVFVNLLVGGSIMVLGFQLRGRRDPDFDRLARAMAATVTVNKSIAVVLGVAPLLLISVLYTIHFYTANALTGIAWMGVIPVIAAAFVLLYVHKYTWDRMANSRGAHIGILAVAVALLLAIPLVFLANANLMMFPGRWTEIRGFADALLLPNVIPRYFHFLGASLVLTSLFGVAWFGRASFPVEATFTRLRRPEIRRVFYGIALVVSIAQFVIGPIVLVTLPSAGIHAGMLLLLAAGVALAVPAVWMIWQETIAAEPGRRLIAIAVLLGAAVVCMAAARHYYRMVTLREHRRAIQVATLEWKDASDQARADLQAGRTKKPAGFDPAELFGSYCGGCHAVDRRLVGPPLTEIAQIYAGNPDGIVAWARAPGKKRADAPQMPSMAAAGDRDLRIIAEYMLKTGAQ